MKGIQLSQIAVQASKFLIVYIFISFLAEVGYLVIKGNAFDVAAFNWINKLLTVTKIAPLLMICIVFGYFNAKKEQNKINKS